MSRRDDRPLRAKVPGDVERKDQLLWSFTARQLVILSVTGLVLYAVWSALAPTVSPLVLLAATMPVAAASFVVAVGRRDGVSLDAWLLAAIRHRRSPRRLVPAGEPIAPPPVWADSGRDEEPPAPLRLPSRGVGPDGLIDLGSDGSTALVAASTVAFGLRSAGEQNGLVAGFGRWLNSLDGPVQILVRAERVDLTTVGDRIHAHAPGLPHPALEEAAVSHVAFLDGLAAERELLRRQVTIAVRDQRSPGHAVHRAGEAVRALAACEVTAQVLDPYETAAAVASCLEPDAPPAPAGLAPAGAVIHHLRTEVAPR
ncbi:PrgI family protein [Virgisporangium ochraceum]|uniref:PrgI family protein n=1 Tax=Virgisporangium ochraceum TaxID=65505 RepID=UPI00194408E5|nr:PrgI family protein [Virgisporangium ochraceum]